MLWGFVLGCHATTSSYGFIYSIIFYAVMLETNLIRSFAGLAICRTILGVFESCVTPILV